MSLPRKLLAVLLIVVLALAGFFVWARYTGASDRSIASTEGARPTLVDPQSRLVPIFGLAKPVGWPAGTAPTAAKGLAVARFADRLDHPRTMLALPNGDVLVAQTNAPAGNKPGGITGLVMGLMMNRVGAGDASPDTVVLLRDADGDGVAEQRFVLRKAGMASPSGMAYAAGTLYIANHDAVLAFAFTPGMTTLPGAPRKLMDLPPGGNHWMRNLLLSPDGRKLYVGVGSATNVGEGGMAQEEGRAAIWEIDTASGSNRQYAAGMRNPNGMGWNPSTGELWAVVQERDMIGNDLVPDYLTNVPVGAQYGWPWVYWKDHPDGRVTAPMPAYMLDYTRKPEYALGAHTAGLGMVFATGGERLGAGLTNGAFIARHGSWNRRPLVGYDVVFVGFDANGNPRGAPRPVLGGFLTAEGSDAHGRPVWLAWDKTGALLVSDDTGGVIWRVFAPGAAAAAAPRAVVTARMKPGVELKGGPQAEAEARWAAQHGLPGKAAK